MPISKHALLVSRLFTKVKLRLQHPITTLDVESCPMAFVNSTLFVLISENIFNLFR